MAITDTAHSDPRLLRAFLAVAETLSFTAAARRLGTRQSTVSQQIARLEASLDRKLLVRDTHSVALTIQGATLLPFARDIVAAAARLDDFLTGRAMSGLVRLGISEDFALAGLAGVLADFRRQHADVEIELIIGLSGALHAQFDAGQLDVIFAKRQKGDRRGLSVWKEELAWLGHSDIRPSPDEPLPLILYPPPSVTRSLALETLQRIGRSWKIVCTASSLNGLRAAAQAGLGFLPHSARLVPAGLAVIAPSKDLPSLGEIEFVVIGRGAKGSPAGAVAAALAERARSLAGPGDRLDDPRPGA